jgi:hypothetical protein
MSGGSAGAEQWSAAASGAVTSNVVVWGARAFLASKYVSFFGHFWSMSLLRRQTCLQIKLSFTSAAFLPVPNGL